MTTSKPSTMAGNNAVHGPGTVERKLRQELAQPGNGVAEAMGWGSSDVSRFLSGQQGVPIGKLDVLLRAIEYVIISRRFFDGMGVMAEVGFHCRCAREGAGQCGPGQSGCSSCK